MSLIVFFGGATFVILLGFGVVVHGVRHHLQEKKKENSRK